MPTSLQPLAPDATAEAVPDHESRRRTREMMVLPGATDMLAEAFERGTRCTGDFTVVDHLSLADQPLADVRAHFGVPPLPGGRRGQ
jgi:hypothetical protein